MLNVRLESSDQFLDGRYRMRSLYSRFLTLSSEIGLWALLQAMELKGTNGLQGGRSDLPNLWHSQVIDIEIIVNFVTLC